MAIVILSLVWCGVFISSLFFRLQYLRSFSLILGPLSDFSFLFVFWLFFLQAFSLFVSSMLLAMVMF